MRCCSVWCAWRAVQCVPHGQPNDRTKPPAAPIEVVVRDEHDLQTLIMQATFDSLPASSTIHNPIHRHVQKHPPSQRDTFHLCRNSASSHLYRTTVKYQILTGARPVTVGTHAQTTEVVHPQKACISHHLPVIVHIFTAKQRHLTWFPGNHICFFTCEWYYHGKTQLFNDGVIVDGGNLPLLYI